MMNGPALRAFCATIRSGAVPTTAQYAGLVHEVGYSRAEATDLIAAWARATAARPTAEEKFLQAMRTFAIRND